MGWRFVDGQLKLKQLNKGTVEIVNDSVDLSLSLFLSEVERRMALILLGGQYQRVQITKPQQSPEGKVNIPSNLAVTDTSAYTSPRNSVSPDRERQFPL